MPMHQLDSDVDKVRIANMLVSWLNLAHDAHEH